MILDLFLILYGWCLMICDWFDALLLINDNWWLMIGDRWLMTVYQWLMINDWRLLVDDCWLMGDDFLYVDLSLFFFESYPILVFFQWAMLARKFCGWAEAFCFAEKVWIVILIELLILAANAAYSYNSCLQLQFQTRHCYKETFDVQTKTLPDIELKNFSQKIFTL